LLFTKEHLVEVNELKERSRSGIVVSSHDCSEFLVSSVNGEMNEGHVLTDLLFDVFLTEVDFLEESISDINEGFFRPVLEPINSSGIDKSREHTSPDSEFITNG
jgi:hypothetical protein